MTWPPGQWVRLASGPLLAAAAFAAVPDVYTGLAGEPVELGLAGRATAAIAVWMAAWWISEAISIFATALLPLMLFPLAGVSTMRAAAAPYANEIIFLFMGGFFLALAMERWGLHRRLALRALQLVGERPSHMVAGFMGVAAALSMWVSNTATAVMMLPVALSVVELVEARAGESWDTGAQRRFAVALLLGIAYGAAIGGMATPIGTPPNLFAISFISAELGQEISFAGWMSMALPLCLVFLPIAWWLLTYAVFPVPRERVEGGRELVQRELAKLGAPSQGERIVMVVFACACVLWITRPLVTALEIMGRRPLAGLDDTGVAMLAALALFTAPDGDGGFVLEWETAVRLPWGILLLFGGGLSLAAAIDSNGIGKWLGAQGSSLAGFAPVVVVAAVVIGMVFLTEVTSNTAATAALVPVVAALAPGLGVPPLMLVVPATISASCAFMLPVATPPNAVVFSSGRVRMGEMVRAGLWLNAISIVLITALTFGVIMPLLATN